MELIQSNQRAVSRNRPLSDFRSLVAWRLDTPQLPKYRKCLFWQKYFGLLYGWDSVSLLSLFFGRRRRKAQKSGKHILFRREWMEDLWRMACKRNGSNSLLYPCRRFSIHSGTERREIIYRICIGYVTAGSLYSQSDYLPHIGIHDWWPTFCHFTPGCHYLHDRTFERHTNLGRSNRSGTHDSHKQHRCRLHGESDWCLSRKIRISTRNTQTTEK